MGMKEYLNDILEAVVTTAKGMRITARYGVDPREEVTLQYPEERWEIPERFRGFLHNDIATCIVCNMCVKICPMDCISLDSVRGADKKPVLASYDINVGRCMYCGLCVEVCPPKSLTHTAGYEMASTGRDELILRFVKEDASEIKARVARQVAEAAAAAEKAAAEKPAAQAPPAGGKAPEAAANPAAAQPPQAKKPADPGAAGDSAPKAAPPGAGDKGESKE